MSMTNASTTFGAVRRPEVAHPRDESVGRAMADHIVYTENAVTQNSPSSITDAMVSHSSNAWVA
jgi:hypothetical protein